MLGFLFALPILCLSQQTPVNTGPVLPRHGIDFLGPLWLPRQFKITCCRGGSPEAYNPKWISNWTQTVSDYAVDENAPLGQDDHCRGSFLLSGSALVNFSFSAGGHGGVKCKCPVSPIALDKTCRQLPPCRNNGYRSLSMGGQCACNDPFFGELCEKNCDQGQILKSVDGRAYCSCTPFYQGEQCNEMVCLNGGAELNGRCSCPAPYLGYHCEVDQNRSSHTGSRFQRFGENSEVFSRDISGTVFSLVMIVVLVVSMYLLMKHRMQVQSRFASTRRDEMSRASAIYGLPPAQAHEARIAPFLAMGVEGPPPYAVREGRGRQRNEILPPLPTYEDATKDQPLRTWAAPETNNVPSSSNETATGTMPTSQQATVVHDAQRSTIDRKLENCLPRSADQKAHDNTHMTPGTVKVFVSESPVFCDPSSGKSSKTSSAKESLRRIAGNIYEDETGFKQFVCTLSIAILIMLLLISLLLVFSGTDANPAQKEPRFEWPKPSDSVEKVFKKAAVTTDHGICSGIAGDVLKRGGNAVDASISVMFCLGATNPQSSGLGGGFLMTLYKKDEGKCYVIDARESAPAAATENMYVGDTDSSKYGFKSAGTPGELAGYWYIFKHFGSGKVTWKSLIDPTIKLCRDGVPVSRYLDDVMKVKERHFRLFPSMKAWINPATNATYKEGDLLPRIKLASTLELIANSEDPVQMFYHGEMAETMAKEFKEEGGIITAEDFANFKVRVEEGILINDHFRGDLVMCGGPAPSSFVVTQLIISVMSKLYPEGHDADIYSDPKVMHHFVEAMKFAYAQRTLLGDHHYVESARLLAQNMTTPAYTDWVLSRIKETAQPDSYYGGIEQAQPADHGTSQITVLDEHGNAVSATSTINRWFGAAVESEKYGIVWNDEMDDFSTPGTVNGFGFAPSETNFIQPGKRPMSSMSPMVIYNKVTKEPKLVGGASGGSKIISALAKAVIRSLIFGDTIKEAIDAPMYHNQFTPNIIQTDGHFPKKLKSILEWKYKQTFRNTTGFEGISQVIDVEHDGIHACGDFRRKTKQIPSGY